MEQDTIRRLVGEMLTIGFEGLTLPLDVREFMIENGIANVILFQRNVASAQQLQQLTEEIQDVGRAARLEHPVMISIDQENGTVGRLSPFAPGLMGNMAVGASFSTDVAYRSAAMTASILRSLGVNTNWAPVLDVNNNPLNPVIGVRSFGDSAERVAQLGVETIRGMRAGGVISCGKHFPGHGDTDVDSHLGLPVISHSRERLDALELLPFKAAIQAGVDMLMTAHVVFRAIADESLVPATLSRAVLTGLLRQELGFQGVIVTDCLEMDAIAETVGIGEGAVLSVRAGADMVLVSHRLDRQREAIESITRAIFHQKVALEQIEQSVQRIRRLKADRLAFQSQLVWSDDLKDQCQALQRALVGEGLTALNWGSRFPLSQERITSVAVCRDTRMVRWVASGDTLREPLVAGVAKQFFPQARVDDIAFPEVLATLTPAELHNHLEQYDLVVAEVDGTRHDDYVSFLRGIGALRAPYAVLLLRTPYDGLKLPEVPMLLALYENTPWMVEAALRAIVGEGPINGRLPVRLSDEWPRGYSGGPSIGAKHYQKKSEGGNP